MTKMQCFIDWGKQGKYTHLTFGGGDVNGNFFLVTLPPLLAFCPEIIRSIGC